MNVVSRKYFSATIDLPTPSHIRRVERSIRFIKSLGQEELARSVVLVMVKPYFRVVISLATVEVEVDFAIGDWGDPAFVVSLIECGYRCIIHDFAYQYLPEEFLSGMIYRPIMSVLKSFTPADFMKLTLQRVRSFDGLKTFPSSCTPSGVP